MRTYGNAGTGNTYADELAPPDLPRPSDGVRPAHRPWCRDCKRTHDASDLNDDGLCDRCARAEESRAAAAERRAADPTADQVWDEALAQHKKSGGRAATPRRRSRPAGSDTERVPGSRPPRRPRDRFTLDRPAPAPAKPAAAPAPPPPRTPDQVKVDLHAANAHRTTAQRSYDQVDRHLAKLADRRRRLMDQVAALDTEISARREERTTHAQTIGRCDTRLESLQRELVDVRPTKAQAIQEAARIRKERLEQLGTTTKQVKEWAVEHGLLTAVTRGTVADSVVDAYEKAHQKEQA